MPRIPILSPGAAPCLSPRLQARASVWSPVPLAVALGGAVFDISDLSSLYSDSAGTTPAVVDGVVGRMSDLSGNGNHATQVDGAKKPVLRTAAGLYWLEFDGVDDRFTVSGPVQSGPTITTAFAFSREHGVNGRYFLSTTWNAEFYGPAFGASWDGTNIAWSAPGGHMPIAADQGIAHTLIDIGSYTDSTRLFDGTEYVYSTAGPTVIGMTGATSYIGINTGLNVPMKANFYGAVFVDGDATSDRLNIEAWLNTRAGL